MHSLDVPSNELMEGCRGDFVLCVDYHEEHLTQMKIAYTSDTTARRTESYVSSSRKVSA